MSVSGISSSNLFNYNQDVANNLSQFRQGFQQLGQDLEAGNLSAAQQDFVTLQNLAPQTGSTSTNPSPLAQEFSQLAQDLQSGNLSAAQQDYTKIQQTFQQATSQGGQVHHHHHHHHSGGGEAGEFSQLFGQLGQALQSGNLSSAQQVYATLQQDFPQLGASNAQTSTQQTAPPATTGVSVSA